MATSGTTNFDLDFTDIAEEAWERAGREMRSGYDLRTARRSMNLMMIEWQNRGVNLWTIDEGTISLVAGTAQYSLPTDTIDLIEQAVRTDSGEQNAQNDRMLARVDVPDFASIPNKLTQGLPTRVWVERLAAPRINLWPVPDSSDYIFKYWRIRRIEDAGAGVTTADMSFRFLPALVAGLAFHIAMKIPELAPRIDMLRATYEDQFRLAAEEDRDKTPLRLVPKLGR